MVILQISLHINNTDHIQASTGSGALCLCDFIIPANSLTAESWFWVFRPFTVLVSGLSNFTEPNDD